MATVFWDRKGVLLIEFLPDVTDTGRKYINIVNGYRYFDTVIKLKQAIKMKRPEMLSNGVFLIQNNDRPRKHELVQHFIDGFGWKLFPHPAYSPDTALSDFHTFPGLKNDLEGKGFPIEKSLRTAVNRSFAKMDVEWYCTGIDELVSRYNKCLDLNGDYIIEKEFESYF